MQTETLRKAIETGVEAAIENLKLNQLKKTVEEGVESGLTTTRRAIKRGRHNAEEMLDTATSTVKKNPWRAVGMTFGIGVGIGAIIGVLAARNGHHS